MQVPSDLTQLSVETQEQRLMVKTVTGWWQPPRLRTVESDGVERHATWLELFYDLAFMAAISQLGLGFKSDFSWAGLFRLVFLFVPVWWAWTGMAFYATRFDRCDLMTRLFYALQIMAVAAMAINMEDGLNTTSVGFAISYAVLRFLLVAEYLIAGKYIAEARPLTQRYATGFSLAAALWLLSVFAPLPQRLMVWAAALLIDFGTPLTARRSLHVKLPPHASHISERYGLFTLLVLGETVLAAVNGVSARAGGWDFASTASAFAGLILAFSFWWIYFDHANASPVEAVRNRADAWLYQRWLYTHLPLTLGLTVVGVAVQHIILSVPAQPVPSFERWVFGGAMIVSLLSVGVIHVTSNRANCILLVRRTWFPYLLAMLFIGAGAFSQRPVLPAVLCIAVAVIAAALAGFHVYTERYLPAPCDEV